MGYGAATFTVGKRRIPNKVYGHCNKIRMNQIKQPHGEMECKIIGTSEETFGGRWGEKVKQMEYLFCSFLPYVPHRLSGGGCVRSICYFSRLLL